MKLRTYSELMRLTTFKDRFDYLKLDGKIGDKTFGYDRYLNQTFYHSNEWKRARDTVIIRDCGCDLGIQGLEIHSKILIHHMNPIKPEDILNYTQYLLNPEYLICTCKRTHDAIHYGDERILREEVVIRRPNDTCPWK